MLAQVLVKQLQRNSLPLAIQPYCWQHILLALLHYYVLGQEKLQGNTNSFSDASVLGVNQCSSVERTFTVDNEAVLLGKNASRHLPRA